MSNMGKHIDLFEELIRIHSLANEPEQKQIESLFSGVEITHYPPAGKTQQLIDELTHYHHKINKRKREKCCLWLAIFSVLSLLFALLINLPYIPLKKEKVALQNHVENKIVISNDSIIPKAVSPIKDTIRKEKPKPFVSVKRIQKNDTNIIVVIDTLKQTIIEMDTVHHQLIITDTVYDNKVLKDTDHGYICQLPDTYTFVFDKNSALLYNSYSQKLDSLALQIINCQNLKKVNISTYYTRRFLFFTTKKLALQRVGEIKNQLKDRDVSVRILKKADLIGVKKRKSELANRVDILLKN